MGEGLRVRCGLLLQERVTHCIVTADTVDGFSVHLTQNILSNFLQNYLIYVTFYNLALFSVN